jgi:hypothetical protein
MSCIAMLTSSTCASRYDFYSIQPANSRLHLTKLPAEHHPFDIGEALHP